MAGVCKPRFGVAPAGVRNLNEYNRLRLDAIAVQIGHPSGSELCRLVESTNVIGCGVTAGGGHRRNRVPVAGFAGQRAGSGTLR